MFWKINKWFNWFILVMLCVIGLACENELSPEADAQGDQISYGTREQALGSNEFKLPLPPGYEWQITQSWADHCSTCNAKGYDEISNGYYGDFCNLSHSSSATDGCYSKCKYAWDFSLPGSDDLGKPALASSDGTVLEIKTKNANGYEAKGWGNTVVINHGNNVCTRYAHLKDGSISVSKGQNVCQGLKIAEIGGTPNYSPHLHFQFESCDKQEPLQMGFTDGNGIPVCTIDKDIKTNGVYTALKLTNTERLSCGWKQASCGSLSGCPLSGGCGNKGKPSLNDWASMDFMTASAVGYLWQECAVSGKSDGKFHAEDKLTRAEALKIALQTFGLAGNCKASEPFGDVSPSDWFYPYVLCGVKHGLISTIYTGFTPNDEIYFSEAAKLAVEAAAAAGKIEIQSPDNGHFLMLPINHWAYTYLETIYFYGGITSAMLSKAPYDKVTRGEYALMVAALSPCFCGSVACGSGCSCNQASYSCDQTTVQTSGPVSGQTAGSGGGKSSADAGSSQSSQSFDAGGQSDAGYTPQICNPYCSDKQCGSDGCGGSCGTCMSDKFCNPYGYCQSICTIPACESLGYECGKHSLTTPGCGSYLMSCGVCPSGKNCVSGKCVSACTPNCSNKLCGPDGCGGSCGSCPTGWTCTSSGSCSIPPVAVESCGDMTLIGCCDGNVLKVCINKKIYMSACKNGCGWDSQLYGYDCNFTGADPDGDHPIVCPAPCFPSCSGKLCGDDGCGESCGSCPTGQLCASGQCKIDPIFNLPTPAYDCDPDKGYTLFVYSSGSNAKKVTSLSSAFLPIGTTTFGSAVKFYCNELPGAVMINGGPNGVYVWLEDKTLPNFALWSKYKYSDSPKINPTSNPDVVGSYFYTPISNTTLLVRVPHK